MSHADRNEVRAALLALLDSLAEPATVTVHTAHLNATFQLGPAPQLVRIVPGTLRADVYRSLEESEGRLTLGLIMDALMALGREVSNRTVERELEDMAADGLVDNDRKGKPPGYGLKSRRY